MINLPLIAYFLFMIFFLGGFLAVIYHLKVNKINEKISTITNLVFIVGCLLILTYNVTSAIQIDWKALSFGFEMLPTNLDFENSLYEYEQ